MEPTSIFAICKTWGCNSEICLDDTPGFYFYGGELKNDASSFRVICEECGKSHRYRLSDVFVYREVEAMP